MRRELQENRLIPTILFQSMIKRIDLLTEFLSKSQIVGIFLLYLPWYKQYNKTLIFTALCLQIIKHGKLLTEFQPEAKW